MLNNNSKNKILAAGKSAAKKAKPMNVLKYVDTVKHLYDDAPPPKSDAYYDNLTKEHVADPGATESQMKAVEDRIAKARERTGEEGRKQTRIAQLLKLKEFGKNPLTPEQKGSDFYYNAASNTLELKSSPSPLRPKNSTAGAKYIPKEQRIYESLGVKGYETPEKSDKSFAKLMKAEDKPKRTFAISTDPTTFFDSDESRKRRVELEQFRNEIEQSNINEKKLKAAMQPRHDPDVDRGIGSLLATKGGK